MKTNNGFSLIEVLIYLGLFSLIMSGIIISAFQIFQGSGRTQTKIAVQEEGNFLLAKINWIATGLQPFGGITTPALSASGPTLAVIKTDPLVPNPVCLTLNSGKIQFKKDGTSCSSLTGFSDLNNSNVTVNSLTFDHQGSSGGPEYVKVTFSLSSKTASGQSYSQDFTTTKYLRK